MTVPYTDSTLTLSCGVPGCGVTETGDTDDLMARWLPQAFLDAAADAPDYSPVCPRHGWILTADGFQLTGTDAPEPAPEQPYSVPALLGEQPGRWTGYQH